MQSATDGSSLTLQPRWGHTVLWCPIRNPTDACVFPQSPYDVSFSWGGVFKTNEAVRSRWNLVFLRSGASWYPNGMGMCTSVPLRFHPVQFPDSPRNLSY